MASPKFSIGESLSFGWNGMRKHFWFFFVLLVLSVVAAVAMQGVSEFEDSKTVASPWMAILGMVFIVGILLTAMVKTGLIQAQLMVADGVTPTFAVLKPQLMLWLKLFLVYLVTRIILLIGFILLIIPGIYFAVRMQFVYYAVADKGMWPFAAIAYSWRVSRGHWWDLLLFNIVLFLVTLLGVLALVIGLFAAMPTTAVAHAHVYRKLES